MGQTLTNRRGWTWLAHRASEWLRSSLDQDYASYRNRCIRAAVDPLTYEEYLRALPKPRLQDEAPVNYLMRKYGPDYRGYCSRYQAHGITPLPYHEYLHVRAGQEQSPAKPARCPDCDYNLTGNVSGRCPECGRDLH